MPFVAYRLMGAHWSRDFAFEQLPKQQALVEAAEEQNEATTRLRAIDTILFSVLGWDRLSVDSEKYCRAVGFADYVFLQDKAICLVLEAKRDEPAFVLPSRNYTANPVGFALLAKESPAARDALTQASGYAAALGARYSCISNGHQWIFALSFVPNQPIDERSVFVFESLEAIAARFNLFWNCLSPEGIRVNAVAPQLLESRKAPAPAKLSQTLTNYPEPIDRNVVVNELGYILDLVWDEINESDADEQFLHDCYITPVSSDDTLALAKELLDQHRKADELASQEALDSEIVPNLVAAYASDKPIIVLGNVGHGKSTFLKYLRLIDAKDKLKKYIQIDIDFLDRPATANEVGRYINSVVEDELLTAYGIDIYDDSVVRACLRSDLLRFQKSPTAVALAADQHAYKGAELAHIQGLWSDQHSYFAKIFAHLKKGRGYSLAIFLDNLDRRQDPIQEEAFLRASAMARDWGGLVFVCLRPSTFFRSRNEGVLDAVAPKIITIVSPRISVLLKKRFEYARRFAEGETVLRRQALRGPLGPNVTLDLPRVADLLGCFAESFFRERQLTSVFEAVSNGNVRDMLRYVKEFITSRHLNTKKILDKIPKGYRVPDHEALRALLFGNYWHYDPSKSIFVNMFDIVRADPSEHFSRLLTLQYLARISDGPPNRGFCGVIDVVRYLCQLGYSGEHARETLQALYERKCCEARVTGVEWSRVGDDLRISSLGKYHVTQLVRTFTYFDSIVVDTPILDSAVRAAITDERAIDYRLRRARTFVDYLNRCIAAIQDADAVAIWREIYDEVCADISYIEGRPGKH